jgi:pimeloyl-ACP methyl ester carboxylesterase
MSDVWIIKDRLLAYQRPGRRNTRCVIFVHGIVGDVQTTWKAKDAQSGFVDLVKNDRELEDYDVFCFGYRSGYFRGAPIDNAAVQLRSALARLESRYEIVFIAHSMGGLVCMKYIVDELQRAARPLPIAGLLLYGTPTTGSDLINIAKLVGYGVGLKIPFVSSAMNMLLKSQTQLTDLATGSKFLEDLHDQWALRVVNGGHDDAGDGRMWLPVRAVTGEDDVAVKQASGKGVYGAIDWRPISCDHLALVKPKEANDERYLAGKDFLQISRRIKPYILDRVWKASQDIWGYRFARVSDNLEFFTAIRDKAAGSATVTGGTASASQQPLADFTACETECAYDFVLEKDNVEFGVSFGDNGLWGRESMPVYVHQIGLNLLPETEKTTLRSSLRKVLANPSDKEVWSFFFPRLSLRVDDHDLQEGAFTWPPSTREFANWILRRYNLPQALHGKVGTKIRLKISYKSIVPMSLPQFTFSAPWIVGGNIGVRVVVEGSFNYFVASHRLVPNAEAKQREEHIGTSREVAFAYNGIMLPGSVMEVRWQRK